jgi:curved DNA-binding protein
VRGRDYEATIQLSLEDPDRGTTVSIDVAHGDGTRTLAVTVPPGATEGQLLRLRGRGGPGAHGGEAGDIYLHMTLLPHAVFRPDGHDLSFDLVLAPWEAALGGDVEVPTLDGPVVLAVPAGSRPGRKLRLRQRGLATRQGGRGDLYALVRVDVPSSLTPRERELFEELARASPFDPRRIAGHEAAHGG